MTALAIALACLLVMGISVIVLAVSLTGAKETSEAEDRVEAAERAYLDYMTRSGN